MRFTITLPNEKSLGQTLAVIATASRHYLRRRGDSSRSSVLIAVVLVAIVLAAFAGLVSGILASQASWKYSAICCSTIFAYSAYTLGVTQWRTKFRKQMIALENEASAKVRLSVGRSLSRSAGW